MAGKNFQFNLPSTPGGMPSPSPRKNPRTFTFTRKPELSIADEQGLAEDISG
jgi:hypothetical protein